MIKEIIDKLVALLAVSALLASCSESELWQNPQTEARDGYIMLNFKTEIPAMQEVVTRAVDPDGGGVQDMTLFCFDSYGLFISTVKAGVTVQKPGPGEMEGTFKAEVPENTRTIHFLANQNMDEFKEDSFRNKSESEVMAVLEGSSGRMIYWGRFACDAGNDSNIAEQMATSGNSVKLIRNHARISVDNPDNNGHIVITGFAVCNTNAFGTVAPHHPKKGFDFTWPSSDDPFVTLPVNDAKMSDITDVTSSMNQYVFECENSADAPVSVILRGHLPDQDEEKYYRVLLVDDKGEQLLVRRNHHYKLHIEGALSFGQASFAEALEAAATNNVWISISDEVNEVEDTDYILTVEKTFVVLDESFTENGGSYTLNYTIKGKNDKAITEADAATVSWIDNGVATQTFETKFEVVNGVGQGHIQIHLLRLENNEKLEGTLLVKKGRLQRKIKVITIRKQSFVPAWVGTEIYGNLGNGANKNNRAHVTAMFTIPESCPKELFPMNVYLSVGDLDIRNASGMELPVVREADNDWYSSGEISSVYQGKEPDYKFVYTADGPGVQRVYFENILNQENGYEGTLYIEAEYFETMRRKFKYSTNLVSITVQGLNKYDAVGSGVQDEVIYYRLVPQKKGANVQFDMLLAERSDNDQGTGNDNPANAQGKDEFLLYSQYLDYYEDGEEPDAGVTAFDCKFYPDESNNWWQTNNPQGGRMLMFKPRTEVLSSPSQGTGRYSIYMKTNRARSAEVIHIASNDNRLGPVLPEDANEDNPGIYGGRSYRSTTFELANYTPFRFGARVKYGNNDWQGEADEPDRTIASGAIPADIPEKVTPLEWTYQPDQRVDIGIDVTSFAGFDNKSVDPFGQAFEIYIDAPMLKIDAGRLAENRLDGTKLKAHPTIPGRFVYTVDAKRETERRYGTDDIANTDNIASSQRGERKTLPFLVNSVVSAGDIVISSDESRVVYYSKTFRVSNQSIAGTLQYKNTAGVVQNIPKDAFVSFERTRNGSRIGSVSVTADGQYELRLRKEYEFNWYTDEVELHYTGDGGMVYHATYPSLSSLFASPHIVLEPSAGE